MRSYHMHHCMSFILMWCSEPVHCLCGIKNANLDGIWRWIRTLRVSNYVVGVLLPEFFPIFQGYLSENVVRPLDPSVLKPLAFTMQMRAMPVSKRSCLPIALETHSYSQFTISELPVHRQYCR